MAEFNGNQEFIGEGGELSLAEELWIQEVVALGETGNQLLGRDSSDSAYEWKSIVAGNNITITYSVGQILISSGDVEATRISIDDIIVGGIAGSVLFVNAAGNLAQDNANFFWDDTNKRLGIGTTGPNEKLEVSGNIRLTSDGNLFQFGAAQDYTIQWDGNDAVHTISAGDFAFMGGNVGIGTTGPSKKLDIDGDIRIQDSAEAITVPTSITGDGTNHGLYMGYDDANNKGFIRSVFWGTAFEPLYFQANEFRFSTGSGGITERMSIDAAGVTSIGDGGATNYTEFSATGDLVFVGSAGLAYGEISVKDNVAPTTLNSGADVQLTVFDTDGPSNNTAPDQANNEITITKAGHYIVTVSIHVNNNAAQTHIVDVSLNKNNGSRVEFDNVHGHRTLTGGSGDVGSMSLSGIVDLAVNDELQLWATTDVAADRSITFEDITLSIVQIGGT